MSLFATLIFNKHCFKFSIFKSQFTINFQNPILQFSKTSVEFENCIIVNLLKTENCKLKIINKTTKVKPW
jgi:hypothetical protein